MPIARNRYLQGLMRVYALGIDNFLGFVCKKFEGRAKNLNLRISGSGVLSSWVEDRGKLWA